MTALDQVKDSGPSTRRRRGAARDGVRDALSIVVAYVPFALAIGAALTSTSVAPFAAWSSSWLVFAGAAQLVAVDLLDGGAPAAVVVLTALVVNARHLLYSAALAPHTRGWSTPARTAAAYVLADPVYALAAGRFDGTHGDDAADRWRYYLAAGLTCWSGWVLLTAAGGVLAGSLPDALPLDLAAPLTFLLLLLPTLRDRAGRVAALVGGVVAVVAGGLPLKLGLLAGALAGVVAGAIAASRAGGGDRRG